MKNKFRLQDFEMGSEFNAIIEFLKIQLVELLTGKFNESYRSHVSEIVLLVADKSFPNGWDELNKIFFRVFELSIEEVMSNFMPIYNLNDLFYRVVKQINRKRTPTTRSKFLQFKNLFIDNFFPFYQKVNQAYAQIFGMNNEELFVNLLKLLKTTDKILLILIDSFFSINEFHNDIKMNTMLETTISKAYFILQNIEANAGNQFICELFHQNLFKFSSNSQKLTQLLKSISI